MAQRDFPFYQEERFQKLPLLPTFVDYPFPKFTKDFRGLQDFDKLIEITPGAGAYFMRQPYLVYHGTSTEALDAMLGDKRMLRGVVLHSQGRLVYGEMKRHLDERGDGKPSGPKFLHPDVLEKLGIKLTEEDKRIFGHAFAIFFSPSPEGAMGYTHRENDKKAVLVLNRNALEARGHVLVDCKGEGIKCEGDISLDFGLSALLVPDSRVEEYKGKASELFTGVYPLSDLERVGNS